MLTIDSVTKRFGTVTANNEVSLRVAPGEVVGLLGHNGAGKTTLVNQVVGIAKPDSGSISIGDLDAVVHPAQARRRCAIQPQAHVPISGLTPALAVELVGRIRGVPAAQVRARAQERFEQLDIADWARRPTEKLSGGATRLVAFAIATAAPVPLLVLDEPTNDVDPVRRRLLWQAIRSEADHGTAVLLVTHNVNEAERAVDRLVVLDHGSVVASGSPSELTAHLRDRMRVELRSAPGRVPTAPPEAHVTEARDGALSATVPATAVPQLIGWAEQQQATGAIETFAVQPASLEDAYIQLTSARSDVPSDEEEVSA